MLKISPAPQQGFHRPDIMLKILSAAGFAIALVGCTFGMRPGGVYPKLEFDLPLNYEDSLRRAENHFRKCAAGGASYADLDRETRTGSARVNFNLVANDADAARIDVAYATEKSTHVTITVVNGMGWNEAMMRKIKASMEQKSPVC